VKRIPDNKMQGLNKPWKRLYLIAGSLVLLLIFPALIVTHSFFQDDKNTFTSGLSRFKGVFSFMILGKNPGFYYVTVEKNGKDYRMKTTDILDVTYRDEFVVKDVMTDVIFGSAVSVDVDGIGTKNDIGKLMRGIELVDQAVMSKGMHLKGEAVPAGSIRIKYHDNVIANVPMRVIVTPQDWLRYAKNSENAQTQMEYLKKAIAINSKDIGTRKMLAALCRQSGMEDRAIAQYKEVLALKPGDQGALTELFKCHMDAKEYRKALEVGLDQIKMNPKDPVSYVDAALAYERLQDWGKAIESYKMALNILPEDHDLRFRLAEVYERTKSFGNAAELYRQILSKSGGDVKAMMAMAGTYFKAGNYDESIKWYKEIIKKQPRNATAHANIGFAYGSKGQWKEEIDYYRKAISLNPKDPIVQYNLAMALEKQNLDKEAEQAYQRVLKINPHDSDAMFRLANIAYKNKQYDKAIGLFEKNIKAAPQKATAYANLGFAYGELKKYKQSAENYENSIRNGNKDPQIHYNLAYTYGKLGKKKESIAEYEIYAASRPTAETLNMLAEQFADDKQYDKAIDYYRKLLDLTPRKAAAYSGIAYIYGLKNEPDKAIEYYRMSLKYDPEDNLVYLHLGEAYEKKGMYEEAFRAYREAYSLNPESTKAAKKIPQMKIKMLQKKNAG
jgi:tetratricopeptide (TPR) repeat protein